jgi:hypothetical protein
MKTLIKITALAVLAALAAFSCTPEAELSGVDWNEVNSNYNSEKNSSPDFPTGFSYVSSLSIGADADNELVLTFPAISDFLRNSDEERVKSGLSQFLSFHHFTEAVAPIAGKADTIGGPLQYSFVKRNGNIITVKLTKTFVASDSNVVMKIDGTKYTFAGGNKLDLIGRGKGGEAGYDDIYVERNVSGANGPSDFVEPGNKGWYLSLSSINRTPSSATEVTLTDYPIATLNLYGADSDIYTAVATELKPGLKIQKLENGAWNPVNGTINYDSVNKNFIVNSLTLADLVPFRVMWERNAPVTTAGEYFGVKQYIKIIGENTGNPWYWRPAYYQTGKVYGPVGGWYNTYEGKRFNALKPIMNNVSKDSRHRNVAFELLFNGGEGIIDGATTYWLKDFNNDKQKFKENFKIAYYGDLYNSDHPGGFDANENYFTYRPDLVYIDIKDVEFFSYNPYNSANIGLNAIRITLDPAYEDNKKVYFYISPEIRYADDKTTFGDPTNLPGFFRAYNIPGLANDQPPNFLLSPGVWTDGNLSSADSENWHFFPVTAGNYYYIWWNSTYTGDGSKTAWAVVGARYIGSNDWIFGGSYYDAYYNSPQSFYAYQDGIVEIRIIPYGRSSYNIGSYGIGYSTTYTSPNY